MNTLIWILQGLLAVYYIIYGSMQTTLPEENLHQKMPWVEDVSLPALRFIGLLQMGGAIGLIVPMAIQIVPQVTTFTAMFLALISAGAVVVHILRAEPKFIVHNFFLFLAALFVAIYRFP